MLICPAAYTYDPVPGAASPGAPPVLYRGLSPWLPWPYPSQYPSRTCSDEFLRGLPHRFPSTLQKCWVCFLHASHLSGNHGNSELYLWSELVFKGFEGEQDILYLSPWVSWFSAFNPFGASSRGLPHTVPPCNQLQFWRHFLSSRILINVFIYKACVSVYVHPCVLLTIPEHTHQPEVEQELSNGGRSPETPEEAR